MMGEITFRNIAGLSQPIKKKEPELLFRSIRYTLIGVRQGVRDINISCSPLVFHTTLEGLFSHSAIRRTF